MQISSVEKIYKKHIKSLSSEEQLKLMQLIANQMGASNKEMTRPAHSIMELHGLGADIWRDIDAQEYVNRVRSDWDNCE